MASTGGDVVGIAGCGTMGLPMAQCLRDAGVEVWGHDVRPSGEFGDFAPRMIADAKDFAGRCDVVFPWFATRRRRTPSASAGTRAF